MALYIVCCDDLCHGAVDRFAPDGRRWMASKSEARSPVYLPRGS